MKNRREFLKKNSAGSTAMVIRGVGLGLSAKQSIQILTP